MYTVVGGILLVLGFFGASMTVSVMATNSSYTWSAPFTDFESMILFFFTLSVIAIMGGIVTFIFGYSKAANKNALDSLVNDTPGSDMEKSKCKNCGMNLTENCNRCPACGTERD